MAVHHDTQVMARPFASIGKVLDRWSRQQESALGQMTRRRTVGQRIAGFSKSERVDAKVFLFAVAPFVPIIVSDQAGWSRGTLWHAWFWVSVVWAIAILALGFAGYWRAFRRSFRKKP